MNILKEYERFCVENDVLFSIVESVRPYDETTLFCPAGMQQHKKAFKDESHVGTIANVQSCVRLNDVDLIGDGTHLIHFKMLGLFSFRQWNVERAIGFWMKFIVERLGIKLSYVDLHPSMLEWKRYYELFGVEVRENEECTWSDGGIGGYCTEFFVDDVEIGNIVNPLGSCIDVGFGLERLDGIVNGTRPQTAEESLRTAIDAMVRSGYEPSNLGQGFVLRKLMRKLGSI